MNASIVHTVTGRAVPWMVPTSAPALHYCDGAPAGIRCWEQIARCAFDNLPDRTALQRLRADLGTEFPRMAAARARETTRTNVEVRIGHTKERLYLLANTAGESLRLYDRPEGLEFDALLSDLGADATAIDQIRDGTIVGVSVSYVCRGHTLEANGPDGLPVVTVQTARLNHLALVRSPARPAYPETSVRITRESLPRTGGAQLRGYALLWEDESQDLGGFVEVFDPDAFTDSVARDDVRALFNHDPSAVLGRNVAGTLRLAVDERGLAFEIDLPDTSVGRDVSQAVGRGDLGEMSVGFVARRDSWERGGRRRRVLQAQLRDISVATYSAYTRTRVELVSARRPRAGGARDAWTWRRQQAIARHGISAAEWFGA